MKTNNIYLKFLQWLVIICLLPFWVLLQAFYNAVKELIKTLLDARELIEIYKFDFWLYGGTEPVVSDYIQEEKKTIILARNFKQAQDYAKKNLIEEFQYPQNNESLYGYRNINLIKLNGWQINKSKEYIDIVKRLESFQ